MRRSAAPSQLNQRPNSFAPPYKKARFVLPDENCFSLDEKHSGHSVSKVKLDKKKICESTNEKLTAYNLNKSSDDSNLKLNSFEHSETSPKFVEISSQVNDDSLQSNSTKFSNEQGNCISLVDRKSTNCENLAKETRYYSVVWCKLSKKKHKSWEGDAVLLIQGRSVTLKDTDGKNIGKSSGYKLSDLESLEVGSTLPVGGKEVEIIGKILKENFISGKCFQESVGLQISDTESPIINNKSLQKKFKPFCLPMRNILDENQKEKHLIHKCLFNASDPDSIVLPRPTSSHQWLHNTKSLPITDVVIDPRLAVKLRPHQQAGIIFLYECVMGFKFKEFKGAILADEMGLGKTLQCITLIWTLLKQGPYGCSPVIRKVLIVTPSSICANWGKEFDKWLGTERVKTYIVDQQNKVQDFVNQKISPIMILSYELLIRNIEKIKASSFDLLVCDEGHRLKNGNIKTSSFLSDLGIKKRIIITGTPIQNDLQELFSLVEFVNPGILGTSSMFKNIYEDPIIRSHQPNATNEEKQLGESRTTEFNRLTSQFILRRTQEIINRYLPPKSEYVVFCQQSQSQSEIYQTAVSCSGLKKCLLFSEVGDHLSAICILRKLCNHPALLRAYDKEENLSEIQNEIVNLLPESLSKNVYLEQDSGKLAVVSCLLWSIAEIKRERVVIVSNFTTTLDMLQQLCEKYNYGFLRLDGSTPTSKRQCLVDRFNRNDCREWVFLLSSKAGGVGLNLIGASRIILFDIDWNPATDLQAMARVWRDGQKKNVYIYRLLLSGSIEEKIYQRQVSKQSISGSVVDARSSSKVKFSIEELKDLFQFYPNASCLTHKALNCSCDQLGGIQQPESLLSSQDEEKENRLASLKMKNSTRQKVTTMDQLLNWQHFDMTNEIDNLGDPYLESASDFISFVFKCQSN